ncbi:MAG TPA: acyl carrier protein [Vicinamibacteria bacterium]|jgi:acyl carrier protein
MPDVATSAAAVRQSVIDWLDDNYHFGDAERLIETDDASFLDRGILDSLGYVQLILHLEKAFRLRIDRKDLSRANFDSLGKIVTYVVRHPEYRP